MTTIPKTTIQILPATPSDISTLASIFDVALKVGEPNMYDFIQRYGHGDSLSETCAKEFSAALSGTGDYSAWEHHLFKAVAVTEDQWGNLLESNIVGVCHWRVGCVEGEKLAAYEAEVKAGEKVPTVATEIALLLAGESTAVSDEKNAGAGSEKAEETFDFLKTFRKPMLDTYYSHIGDKKHFYLIRIAVLPEYQRRGIAAKLLQWGTEKADEEQQPAWLNGRPAGRGSYEKAGWKAVNTIPMPVPGLVLEPMACMMRVPRPVS